MMRRVMITLAVALGALAAPWRTPSAPTSTATGCGKKAILRVSESRAKLA